MARPLRIEYPGAIYHVMNRGNQRQNVFRSKVDCEAFIDKLGYFAELFNVKVYCYVLMNNHFHLLLCTKEANLGRFMQSFLTSFSITVNRRTKKSGHLFQGRYKAQLVESRKYLSSLSRYIHLNPLRVKKYHNIKIDEKRNILLNYTWSSFGAHIGIKKPDGFLDINPVLSSWGRGNIQRMKKYRAYVEEGLYKDIDNPFELAIRQQIIGTETFADRITRTQILGKKIKSRKEEPMLYRFQTSMDPEHIINVVAQFFNIDKSMVLKRKSTEKQARKIAMFLCSIYCNSRMSLTDLGKLFSVSLSGLTRTRDRVKQELEDNNKELVKLIKKINNSIAEV